MQCKIINLALKKMTLSEIVGLIPKETFGLDLTASGFDSYDSIFLKQLFEKSPKHLSLIKLSLNALYLKNGADLALAFSGLGENIRELDLSYNNFHVQPGAETAKAFKGLPETLVSLNMAGNFLGKKEEIDLIELFESLKNIRTLNLSSNNLNIIPLATLKNLKGTLYHLERIYLSYSEVASMTLEERLALSDMVSKDCKMIFLDNKDKEFEDTLDSGNLIRKMGLKSEVTSLKRLSFLAIKEAQTKGKLFDISLSDLERRFSL